MEWLRSIEMNDETLALIEARKAEESRQCKVRVHERVAELQREMEEWAELRLAHVNEGEEVRKVKECGYATIAFTLWPSVRDPQRARTLFKLVYWLFIVDDVMEVDSHGLRRHSDQAQQLASHLLHNIFGHPIDRHEQCSFTISSPKELLAVDVGVEWWREIQHDPHVSTTQLKHFETMASEVVLSQVSLAHFEELVNENNIPSLDDYMHVRRASSGTPICLLGTQYELGIELSDEILTHPLMAQLHKAIYEYCIGINDFFSFPKEFKDGQMINLLPLLHVHNNKYAQEATQSPLPFSKAISQVWEMINEQERECAKLASLILMSPLLASQNGIKDYIESLCRYTSAMRSWFQRSARYSY